MKTARCNRIYVVCLRIYKLYKETRFIHLNIILVLCQYYYTAPIISKSIYLVLYFTLDAIIFNMKKRFSSKSVQIITSNDSLLTMNFKKSFC